MAKQSGTGGRNNGRSSSGRRPLSIPDTDGGLGIGGINTDQSKPVLFSSAAYERYERMVTRLRRSGFNADGSTIEYD